MTARAFGVGNELAVDAMGNRVERILDHLTERLDPLSRKDETVFAGAHPTKPASGRGFAHCGSSFGLRAKSTPSTGFSGDFDA